MDEKKKSVSDDAKESFLNNEEIFDFDEIRNMADKSEQKKTQDESDKTEKKDEKAESEKSQVKESEVKKNDSEKSQVKESEVKKDDSDKKDNKNSESEKNIIEKADSEKKEKDKVDIAIDKTEKKQTDNEKSDKTESDNNTAANTSEKKNAAISQSKRLADAKDAAKSTESNVVSEKEKKNRKGIKIFFGTVAALFVIAYIAGFVYFTNYFYPDVTINGINVSNMDNETAKKTLDDFYKQYVLTIETIDGKQSTISAADISMNIELHDDFNNCLRDQQVYLWFVNMMKHHEFTIAANANWDEKALESVFKDMKLLDKRLMTAPKDAYIGIENDKFSIIKEDLGTTIIVDQFKETVKDSLAKVMPTLNLREAGCYKLPKIYDTDEALIKEFEGKSEYINGVISIQMDDLTLEPGIELYDKVLLKSGDSYTISKSAVESYVADLAKKYDTMGKERAFTSTFGNGKQVKVKGTAFGYELDQKATADALYSVLQEKKTTTVDAVFVSKGYTLQGDNDIGDTYIEVNLSEQKVVAYKDGKKVAEGDCVSGCEANGNGTCIGLYAIQNKLSPTVLRGEKKPVTKTVTKKNKKGKKVKVKETKMEYEYESPVTFWMQFNGGYGLHDAAGWRSVYGGSIYYYSGSHGCVNLPYSLAETLYKNFNVGDPVVVYFWDNENRK